MALQLSTDKFGVTFATAYYRVEHLMVTKAIIQVSVSVYYVKDGERINSSTYEMDYDAAGGEPLTQAYLYLKTLPDFAGATDV